MTLSIAETKLNYVVSMTGERMSMEHWWYDYKREKLK